MESSSLADGASAGPLRCPLAEDVAATSHRGGDAASPGCALIGLGATGKTPVCVAVETASAVSGTGARPLDSARFRLCAIIVNKVCLKSSSTIASCRTANPDEEVNVVMMLSA